MFALLIHTSVAIVTIVLLHCCLVYLIYQGSRPPHQFHGQEACSAFAYNAAKSEVFTFTGLTTQPSTEGTQESVVSL